MNPNSRENCIAILNEMHNLELINSKTIRNFSGKYKENYRLLITFCFYAAWTNNPQILNDCFIKLNYMVSNKDRKGYLDYFLKRSEKEKNPFLNFKYKLATGSAPCYGEIVNR